MESFPECLWIVDDDDAELSLLRQVLKRRQPHCAARPFENPEEALSAFAALSQDQLPRLPDLILADLNMPALNGADFLQKVSEKCRALSWKEPPSLIISAAIPLDPPPLPPGCLGLALKPDTPQDLIAILHSYFARAPKTAVSAAVLRNPNGLLLLCRRAPGESNAGLWEFPGGKQEPGEDPAACLQRELKEELNLRVSIGALIGNTVYTGPSGGLHLSFFESRWDGSPPRMQVHDSWALVSEKDLIRYNFCPADRAFIRRFIGIHKELSENS